MAASDSRLPRARTEGLLSRDLPGDELMVYDQERHQAHTLNRTASRVWRQCDGKTDVAELATRLQAEMGVPASDELVGLALAQLRRAHLLQGAVARPAAGLSRRAVIRKLGLAGGLAAVVPLVLSLQAPAAANAVSPVGIPLCPPEGCPAGLTCCICDATFGGCAIDCDLFCD